MKQIEFNANDSSHISAAVSIWDLACGSDLTITPRFLKYNSSPPTGAVQFKQLAIENDEPVGFVIASALPNDPSTSPPETGWVDAIAVLPSAQKRGIGTALLSAAEVWLRDNKCTQCRLGGGLRPFFPGYPIELTNLAFFQRRGYAERADSAKVWDVALDLRDYREAIRQTCPERSRRIAQQIRPAQRDDEKALLEFFMREFPGRWRYEFEEFMRDQRSSLRDLWSLDERGRISDYMILLGERGVDGFARLTFENSERAIERFYMHRLPRPWGQLGPIGVSKEMRGKGLGSALLNASLEHLRGKGVRGCVIDWTDLVDFYARFGFKPYRQYVVLEKQITT